MQNAKQYNTIPTQSVNKMKATRQYNKTKQNKTMQTNSKENDKTKQKHDNKTKNKNLLDLNKITRYYSYKPSLGGQNTNKNKINFNNTLETKTIQQQQQQQHNTTTIHQNSANTIVSKPEQYGSKTPSL